MTPRLSCAILLLSSLPPLGCEGDEVNTRDLQNQTRTMSPSTVTPASSSVSVTSVAGTTTSSSATRTQAWGTQTQTLHTLTVATSTLTATTTALICPGDLRDSDQDKLPDCDELALGTNPEEQDTDGDGLTDYEEVQYKINPFSKDSDGDGLEDGQEVKIGLNPGDATTYRDVNDSDLFLAKGCDLPGDEPTLTYQSPKGEWTMAYPTAFSESWAIPLPGAKDKEGAFLYHDPADGIYGVAFSHQTTIAQVSKVMDEHKRRVEAAFDVLIRTFNNAFSRTGGLHTGTRYTYAIKAPLLTAAQLREALFFELSPFSRQTIPTLPAEPDSTRQTDYIVTLGALKRDGHILTTVNVIAKSTHDGSSQARMKTEDVSNLTGFFLGENLITSRCYAFPAGADPRLGLSFGLKLDAVPHRNPGSLKARESSLFSPKHDASWWPSLGQTVRPSDTAFSGSTHPYRFPYSPITASLQVYKSLEDNVSSVRVPWSNTQGYEYSPELQGFGFYGAFHPYADSRDVCGPMTPCDDPWEDCYDGMCLRGLGTAYIVHHKSFSPLPRN